MSGNNRNFNDSKDLALINLNYVEGKYKIKITTASKNLKELLINKFKIEDIYLEPIEENQKKKTFPIKETIKVIAQIYNNKNVVCKTEKDIIKIFSSKNNYFMEFSIEGRNENKFILSIGLVVYEKFNNTLYQYFNASKTFLDPKLLDENIKSSYQNQNEKNRNRSRSIQPNDFKIKKTFEEREKEKIYNLSDIINIPELANSISNKIFGFRNLGNTCFLNSSLQILIHSPLFIRAFLEDLKKLKPSNNTLVYEFFNLIMNIKSLNSEVFSPEKLISLFLKKCNLFSLGEQSDSQRFYRNLATIFDKELGSNNTCIKEIFKGTLTYSMIYSCPNKFCPIGKSTNSVQQPFYDLIVSVGEKDCTINELINETYKIQILTSAKKCTCGTNLQIIRNCKIMPNKYLSINIQRGKISTRTIKNNVITIDNLFIKENYIYEPYALNFHTGTMDFGHYYR